MDEWELQFITRNLPQLIGNTQCTSHVLTELVSKNVLHITEMNDLLNASQNTQVLNLYQILMTKIQGYSKLHKALHQYNQSGACDILEQGFMTNWPLKISKRIEYDDYYRNGTFSNGRFGGREITVKKIELNDENLKAIRNEVELLIKSDANENILRYFTIEHRGNAALMALEKYEKTLDTWLIEANRPNEITLKTLLRQVTLGVIYLHSLGIVHGNLKPENVVLCRIPTHCCHEGPEKKRTKTNRETESGIRVKIADFGAAKAADEDGVMNNYRSSLFVPGSIGWLAAEILEKLVDTQSGNYPLPTNVLNELHTEMTQKSDVFSLGCMFYYVMSGRHHPFGSSGLVGIPHNILENHTASNVIALISPGSIRESINSHPNDRPNADELLTDKFFNSLE